MINDLRLRLYFLGLIVLVFFKTANGPIVDLVPALASFTEITGWSLRTSGQVISLKWLAIASLASCIWLPKNAITRFLGLLFFSFFMLGLYSQVYSRQLDYIPHSENIHFFLLLALFVVSLSKIEIEKKRLNQVFCFIIGWTYAAAFLTKIDNVGWDWATGETLPAYFTTFWLITESSTLADLARSPNFTKLVGISTLAFELFALPLLLFSKTRNLTILAALIFHFSVWWILGINFFVSYLIGFVLVWKTRESS
ncbi:MAG: hypothetical protein U1E10_11970 [Bdellovibrionales bacterium]|jgi:hypothetical protein|nr:hypothetical protein [Bdellovibrionales bacterium]